MATPSSSPPRLSSRIRWLRIATIALAAFLAVGLILGTAKEGPAACTEKACLCSREGSQAQAVLCNTCASTRPLFRTWIIDISRRCQQKEYVTCPASPDACGDGNSTYCAPVGRELRPGGPCSTAFSFFA